MRKITPYATALAIALIATLARAALTPLFGLNFPFVTYWVAVEIAAYFCGFRAALVVVCLGLMAGRYYFIAPVHTFGAPDAYGLANASFFAVFTICVAMFIESLRVARHIARERLRHLESETSARSQAEEALRESEQRLHSSLKAAGAAAWEWNAASGALNCSDEFFDLAGAPRNTGQLRFEDWMEAVHPDDRVRVKTDLLNASWEPGEYRMEFRVARESGLHWVAVMGRVTKPAHMQGIVVDITERRRMEHKLREVEKAESLGVMAGGIAHDFNNLLTGILGNASLLHSELPPASPAAELARNVMLSSERAAHLTRQMLAYAGQGRFAVERLDLSKQVREAIDALRPAVSTKIEFELDLVDDLPTVHADAAQIEQLVTSLAMNALEAIGPEPGVVLVATGKRDLPANHRLAEDVPAGCYVMLEVRDTGQGMDEATMQKIFDPFFTTKFTGRGLGLAAVLGIVRGHRGAIQVKSAPGDGTVFRVFLPAVAEVSFSAAR